MSTVVGVLVLLFIAVVGVPLALARWASVVPPLARWMRRRLPRTARILEVEAPDDDVGGVDRGAGES